jgi:hypothetical protein
MQENYNPTQHQVWQAAVAATEAAMIAKGHSSAKARKWALKKARPLHPSAQAAVRRNIAANRDCIVGGAA